MAVYPDAGEVIHQPLYDSITLSNGDVGTQTLFTVPLGQAGKSLLDTNLKQSGQLPAPSSFRVWGFSIAVDPAVTLDDLIEIQANVAFEFFVDAKSMFTVAPVGKLGGGMGPWAAASGSGAAALESSGHANGAPETKSIYSMSEYFDIESQQGFQAQLVIPAALNLSADSKLWVYIEGKLTRAVQ